MDRGRPGTPLAAAGLGLLGLGLVLQRAEFQDPALTGLDRPPVFSWSFAGRPLIAVERDRLLSALEVWMPAARGICGVFSLWIGAALARRFASGLGARIGWALALGTGLFLAVDPGLLQFVAERSAVGAETRLDVTHALRGLGLGLLTLSGLIFADRFRTHRVGEPEAETRRPRQESHRTSQGSGGRDPLPEPSSIALPATAPGAPAAELGRRATPWAVLGLAGLALALTCELIVRWVLLDEPLTNDGRAYLFQARLFAEGRMTLPGSSVDRFFPARQIYAGERLFSKYPPGHSLWLAPGVLVAWPALLTRLSQLCLPLLAYAVARGLGSRRPLAVALLVTGSPMVVALGCLQLSHSSSLPLSLLATAATLGGLGALKDRRTGRARLLAAVAGLAASGCVLARPGTGLALALWLVALSFSRAGPRAWPQIGIALLACLPAAGFFAAFNFATTGSVFDTAYALYAREVSPNDRWGWVNRATAVPNTLYNFARLEVWMFGLAPGLLLVVAGLAGCVRRRAIEWLALPLALIGFYGFLRFHGVPWAGPLYWVEGLLPLLLLAVRGCDEFARRGLRHAPRVLWCVAPLASAVLIVEQVRVAGREARSRRAPLTALEQAVGPDERAIVFVSLSREIDRRRFHLPRPVGEPRLLVARSLGADDSRLAKALGLGLAFRFDPVSGRITSIAEQEPPASQDP